jgi:phosphatidate phosphatase APP1
MKSVRLYIGFFIMSLIFPLFSSDLKEDEDVIVFPVYLYLDSSQKEFSVKLHIQVFKKKEDSQKRKFLIESLKGQFAISNEDNAKIFEERIRAFLVDNKRNKKISVTILGERFELNQTEANGHSTTNVKIPSSKISNKELADKKIEITINSSKQNNRTYKGIIYIIPENSTCLISDIDDTIKISDVRNKKVLIQNSFVNPFKAVTGMQELYSKLGASKVDCFLFVSASPWQMYSVLNDFFSKEKFPPALYFMKYFRLKDSDFFNLFEKPEIYKTETIEPIMEEWKKVKFILVGDSGEKDPEAYAKLAVKYPERITKIYIRKAYEENLDSRIKSVFQNIPDEKYQFFKNPDEIK